MKSTGTILDFEGLPAVGGEAIFRAGEPASHPLGVLFKAPWEQDGDGFAEHSRRCARVLALSGVPVHLRGYVSHLYDRTIPESLRPLLSTSIKQYSVEVYQTIVNETILQNITSMAGAAAYGVFFTEEQLRALNSTRILYTVFERDRVSPDLIQIMNRFGQIWVANTRNYQMLIDCGIPQDKLVVIPIPHFADDPFLELRKKTTRKPGPVRFYHIGKWEPRKAQDKILSCFMKAFKPGEAHLFMKTSSLKTEIEDYPKSPLGAIQIALENEWIKKNGWTISNWSKSIQITGEFLSDSKLVKVHEYGDVYVTLSRGEGFEMSAYNAKLAGNLCIYTPSGGPEDYCDLYDFKVNSIGNIPCSQFYNWEPDAQYLNFSEEEAIEIFQKIRNRVSFCFADDRNRTNDLYKFTAKAVGLKMRQALEKLTSSFGGKLF